MCIVRTRILSSCLVHYWLTIFLMSTYYFCNWVIDLLMHSVHAITMMLSAGRYKRKKKRSKASKEAIEGFVHMWSTEDIEGCRHRRTILHPSYLDSQVTIYLNNLLWQFHLYFKWISHASSSSPAFCMWNRILSAYHSSFLFCNLDYSFSFWNRKFFFGYKFSTTSNWNCKVFAMI